MWSLLGLAGFHAGRRFENSLQISRGCSPFAIRLPGKLTGVKFLGQGAYQRRRPTRKARDSSKSAEPNRLRQSSERPVLLHERAATDCFRQNFPAVIVKCFDYPFSDQSFRDRILESLNLLIGTCRPAHAMAIGKLGLALRIGASRQVGC